MMASDDEDTQWFAPVWTKNPNKRWWQFWKPKNTIVTVAAPMLDLPGWHHEYYTYDLRPLKFGEKEQA